MSIYLPPILFPRALPRAVLFHPFRARFSRARVRNRARNRNRINPPTQTINFDTDTDTDFLKHRTHDTQGGIAAIQPESV